RSRFVSHSITVCERENRLYASHVPATRFKHAGKSNPTLWDLKKTRRFQRGKKLWVSYRSCAKQISDLRARLTSCNRVDPDGYPARVSFSLSGSDGRRRIIITCLEKTRHHLGVALQRRKGDNHHAALIRARHFHR